MNNKIIITQSNYIPWKGYFDAIAKCDYFVIYDDMQYTKRDWRNRNIIKTESGLQWLTIPVEVRGKFSQKINETKIADKGWNIKHWKMLNQNYAKAKHYNEVKDWMELLYLNCKFDLLTEINEYFIRAILDFLGIKVLIKRSEEFDVGIQEDKTMRLVDICSSLSATEYFTGESAKAYLDETKFIASDIKVNYINNDGYAEYSQIGHSFEHKVSIVDLIFNKGKQSAEYLKNVK
jgi:hypothetical protein